MSADGGVDVPDGVLGRTDGIDVRTAAAKTARLTVHGSLNDPLQVYNEESRWAGRI